MQQIALNKFYEGEACAYINLTDKVAFKSIEYRESM